MISRAFARAASVGNLWITDRGGLAIRSARSLGRTGMSQLLKPNPVAILNVLAQN
jgi:hypothetical protein